MRIELQRLRPRFITRIDLYVLGEVVGPFLGGVVFFSFVFLMFQALRLADFFINHGVSSFLLLKMTLLLVLSFLPMALPVAFLIGVLVAFGRLSTDSELVAMKAHGISVARLSVPVALLSLAVVGLSLGLNLSWCPAGEHEFQRTLIRVSNTKIVSSIKEGTFTTNFFDLLVYADRVDPETNRLHRVFIYDERTPGNPNTIIAKEAEIVSVKMPTEFGAAAMLKLYDGTMHPTQASKQDYQMGHFAEEHIYLKVEEGMDNMASKPRMIPYTRLREMIDSPTDYGRKPEYIAELWRRYTIAMSPFFFVFLGIGFGTVRTRAVRAGAALIAFLVVLVYYVLQAFGTVAAQKGYLPPQLAMFLPNLVVVPFAIKAFRSANW